MIAPQRHLEIAGRNLASARYLLTGGFYEQAGRDAYLAAFHAAQAFIVLRTGKEPKTHGGTRSEFARLARDEAEIPRCYTTFLANAYELKTLADYEGGEHVSKEEADQAIETASDLVNLIARRL